MPKKVTLSFIYLLFFFISTAQAILLEDLVKNGTLVQELSHKRIGYYLGSFDPLHLGHERVVKLLLEQDLCDFVLIYPIWGGDPLKNRADITQRFSMIYNTFKDHPKVIVTAMPPQIMQSHLTKPTTLISDCGLPYVESAIEGAKYIAIIGSDTALAIADPKNKRKNSLQGIHIPKEYYNHTRGCSRALPVQSFIISVRSGDDISTLDNKIYDRPIIGTIDDANELGLSSTKVRHNIKNHVPIDSMVSKNVSTIIDLHNLYKAKPADTVLWDNKEIERTLLNGAILQQQPMSDFLNAQKREVNYTKNVFLIELFLPELQKNIKAVFKPVDINDQRALNEAYGEVVAYQCSLALSFPNIPPTVMREINGQLGSLQFYVDSNIDAQKDNNYQIAMAETEEKEVQNLKIFYFLLGQWDVGKNNIIIKKDCGKTYLVVIDNGNISHPQHVQYNDLSFVMVKEAEIIPQEDTSNTYEGAFPFHLAKIFKKPIGDNLQKKYGNAFPQSFYDKSNKSRADLFNCVMYKNKLWRQFYAFNEQIQHAYYTKACSSETYKILKNLNTFILDIIVSKSIYDPHHKQKFLNSIPHFNIINAILGRRDTLLKNLTILN